MTELALMVKNLLVFGYFMIAFGMAMVAGRNGRGMGSACTAFFLTLFLFPIGVVYAFIAKGNYKECPHCKNLNHPKASVCRNCGREV